MSSSTRNEVCSNSFKNRHVGKSGNLKVEEIDKLPKELKHLWFDGKFKELLDEFEDIISVAVQSLRAYHFERKSFRRRRKKIKKKYIIHVIQEKINPALPFLSETGYSLDDKVHEIIHECYKKLIRL